LKTHVSGSQQAVTHTISSEKQTELQAEKSSTIEEDFLSLLLQTERISSHTGQSKGTISSYETTVTNSKETECLRLNSRKTTSMSLKKPSVATPIGAAGFYEPALTTLHSAFSSHEDWTQALRDALEPRNMAPTMTRPTLALTTGLDEDLREKTANENVQTMFVNKDMFAGCSMTSTLNTPELNTPVMSNTPEKVESPLKQMLNKEKLEITEFIVPVVPYPAEDPNPITIPADHSIMFPNDFEDVWGQASFTSGPFASDPFQCINPVVAEGLPEVEPIEVDEGIHEPESLDDTPMLCNNFNFNTEPTIVEMSMDGAITVDEGSLCNTEAMEDFGEGEGDLLQWLVDETISSDAEFPDLEEISDMKEFSLKIEKDIPATVTSEEAEPMPSTSSAVHHQFSVSAPTEIKIEVTKKAGRGRPPKVGPRYITPKVPHNTQKINKVSDHIYVVREDKESQRYRRMRDLNNEASKRCRQNRKYKLVAIEIEKEQLEKYNKELKFKVKKMEEIVSSLKKKFISDIANPTPKAKTQVEATNSFVPTQQFGFPTPSHAPQAAVAINQEPTNFPDLFDVWTGPF